jgi:hypothetical protein
MRKVLLIASALIMLPVCALGQQCSRGLFELFQDDVTMSGPCNISLTMGDLVTVTETQGYNLKCVTTSGNSNPGNTYFTNSVQITGTGQRYCGTVLSSPVFCDPIFQSRKWMLSMSMVSTNLNFLKLIGK